MKSGLALFKKFVALALFMYSSAMWAQNALGGGGTQPLWDTVRARLVAVGIPGASAVSPVGTFLPGEDPRAGRWATFNKTECGLHTTDLDAPSENSAQAHREPDVNSTGLFKCSISR